ncbi:MAG TPA: hydroxymethylglutaryl-CoA reductase [Thermoanaerobaculia bacterium]|jgi:hydroxymethylglutaryl-CoA reductase (NADPH)|nr:hydroxymethylglutaryl-CoA reductase [Thermoanaerobaculia bacterium]
MKIPGLILKQMYTLGSLENVEDGVRFSLKNRLSNATVTGLSEVRIDGRPVPLDRLSLEIKGGQVAASSISPTSAVGFPLAQVVTLHARGDQLEKGQHEISIAFESTPFGALSFKVRDAISEKVKRTSVPHDKENDYGPEIVRARQKFVEEYTGVKLQHIDKFSFDPSVVKGNIENFTGVAQVPIGFAGPIKVNGEHAQGEFLIPLATAEGTLVASYNRGIKVLNLAGGVTCTVVGDSMQRAPVFVFDNARDGRDFVAWVDEHIATIREEAEATSSVAKLTYIDRYLSNKLVFLRFNYTTGDAAGQNMVGRATFAACSWILENHDKIRHFYLESNFATDKKSSQINVMRTRGKRVTAEATIPRDILIQHMRVDPETLHYHSGIANVGAFISGANNNGAHSPNGITAMFIATGQDVANVSESSAGIVYTELTPEKDLYISFTIPSLIVATHGGGTNLATQRECLEILGCVGKGKVKKLAEIVAGVVLAGELSLASAISSLDWVSSHEQYGRNR